jgi:hypothetical protein
MSLASLGALSVPDALDELPCAGGSTLCANAAVRL